MTMEKLRILYMNFRTQKKTDRISFYYENIQEIIINNAPKTKLEKITISSDN